MPFIRIFNINYPMFVIFTVKLFDAYCIARCL